jgi:hypothetical protein
MAQHGDLWKWNHNVVKSVCVIFGPPAHSGGDRQTQRCGEVLQAVDTVKTLGIHLKLTARGPKHCEYAASRSQYGRITYGEPDVIATSTCVQAPNYT